MQKCQPVGEASCVVCSLGQHSHVLFAVVSPIVHSGNAQRAEQRSVQSQIMQSHIYLKRLQQVIAVGRLADLSDG